MCKLKSAIILKDRIFMPDYDSHSDMLKELGITDDYLGASKKFVRAELSPADGDVFSDIDGWGFKVDQDILPEWFSEEEYKPKMVEAVKEWAKGRVHIGVDGLKIESGENHYIKDCKDVEIYDSASVWAYGSASVWAYGSASVRAYSSASVWTHDSASVWAYGSASVRAYNSARVWAYSSASVWAYGSARVWAYNSARVWAYGSASVEAHDSASVWAYNSARVWAYGSASVEAHDSAIIHNSKVFRWKNQDTLMLCENATFKDNIGRVIYQSGDYKLVKVKSGKKIGEVE